MAGKKSKLKRFQLEVADDVAIKQKQKKAKKEAKAVKVSADNLAKLSLSAVLQNTARALRTGLSAELAPLGLYAGQDQIILALESGEGRPLGAIADEIGVRPPTMTKTISRLEAQGFVARIANEADGRIVMVALTPQGMETCTALKAALLKVETNALASVKKSDAKGLVKVLAAITANLRSSD